MAGMRAAASGSPRDRVEQRRNDVGKRREFVE
jgi:hypothetical protein